MTSPRPSRRVPPNEFYVYALYRADGITPFYIGMGRGDRWLQHEKFVHKRRSHKNNIILQVLRSGLSEVPKAKLYECLTKAEAIAFEIELIRTIGREPDGPLVNATSGGEGILGLSAEALASRAAAIAAALRRPETRAKLSAASRGRKLRPRTEAEKAHLSAIFTGFRHTDEAKAKIAEASCRQVITPEIRAKMAASRKANHRGYSPESIAKAVAKKLGRTQTPESNEKRRIAMLGFKHSPEALEKLRIANSNPSAEARAERSRNSKAAWERPEHRQKIRAAWERKRAIPGQYELPSEKAILENP